jgi:hypothetical protein
MLTVLIGSTGVSYALPECSGPFWDKCYGMKSFSDGDQYVGEWKNNKFHGYGAYLFSNSMRDRVATGMWKNGKLKKNISRQEYINKYDKKEAYRPYGQFMIG